MTLNISNSMDAAPCRRDSSHGCRHPPPSAPPDLFVERMSEGSIPALWSGQLKIGSVWLDVTPALHALGHAAGPDALLPFRSALLVS